MDIDNTDTDLSLIPASSFPHIIDTIIDFASPSVLLAFRNTCTEYRKRITEERILESLLDGAAGLHLHLDLDVSNNNRSSGYASRCSSDRLVATFPTRDGPCPAPTFVADRVTIVTVQGDIVNGNIAATYPAARILDKAKAKLEVVRIVDFEGATGKIPFQAPKYVLFMDADHADDEEDNYEDMDAGYDESLHGMEVDGLDNMEGIPLPHNSNLAVPLLPSNSTFTSTTNTSTAPSPTLSSNMCSTLNAAGSAACMSGNSWSTDSVSPFPDTVTEIVCNIACSPTAGCTNLTRSQLAALNLGNRSILSNVIYIFQPITEKETNNHARGHEDKHAVREQPKSFDKGKARGAHKNAVGTGVRTGRGARPASSSPTSSAPSSPPRSPPESPALVPFLDNQLSTFPNPDFTIVGCENLRYWADPESTLFARFASIMNEYCDFEINFSHLHAGGFGGNVGLGVDFGDDLSRSKYFKSFPQWTASLARSPHQRAWYELITVP